MDTEPQQKANRRSYFLKWYAANKERCAAVKQRWAENNRDKARTAYKKWLSNPINKLKARKRQKLWRDANVERMKIVARKQYLRRDKEKMRKQCREYYWRNRDSLLERERKYRELTYESQKEHRKEVHRRWARNNRGRIRANANKRRALEASASVNLRSIRAWMVDVKNKATATCYYCGKRISTRKVHFDHIVAIAKGGEHSIKNLCVSCATCNLSKRDRPIHAWVRVGQQVLSL